MSFMFMLDTCNQTTASLLACTASMSSGLLSSFLGALQASLAVLLVIYYGVLAAQFKLLDSSSAKSISKVCVRLFLPMLLITQVGSELHIETASRYIPVLSKLRRRPCAVKPSRTDAIHSMVSGFQHCIHFARHFHHKGLRTP
jgi:hypothetical protein